MSTTRFQTEKYPEVMHTVVLISLERRTSTTATFPHRRPLGFELTDLQLRAHC